jgi:hypothetical protein
MILNNFKKCLNKKTSIQQEGFFLVSSNIFDVGFSQKIKYLRFKTSYYRFFVLSKNTKSINLKLKLSRSVFKTANNLANLNGFYRAKW